MGLWLAAITIHNRAKTVHEQIRLPNKVTDPFRAPNKTIIYR